VSPPHYRTDATELDLYCMFAPHGALLSCRVHTDERTGVCRGVGFVNFKHEGDALAAMAALHGTRPVRLHNGAHRLSVAMQVSPCRSLSRVAC
jgi:RNA recognition motif-containing protein